MKIYFSRLNIFEYALLLSGVVLSLALILLFKEYNISVLQSDPYMYLLQSRQWWNKDLHLPGYAFALWLINILSFEQLDEAILLHLLAIVSWIASVWSFIAICRELGLKSNDSNLLLVLYAFFPLVGLCYAAWPIADSAVCLFVNLLLLGCLRKNWFIFSFALAGGLLIHKVLWPFCGLFALLALLRYGFGISRLLISLAPFILFWLWIAVSENNFLWIIQHDLERHLPSYSNLPVFDGLIGTLLQGSLRNTLKGLFLISIYLIQLLLLFSAVRRRSVMTILILMPLLILGASVNQWMAVAILRFAKISLLAAALLVSESGLIIPKIFRNKYIILLIFAVLVFSQFFYVNNMREYFRDGGILDQKLQLERQIMQEKGLPYYQR